MLLTHAKKLLNQLQPVLNIATSDLKGQPNAAVKMLIKIDNKYIYLVDYSMGTSLVNVKENPHISMAFEDVETSKGYRINGQVEVIESGPEYDKMVEEVRKIDVAIVVNRVLKGLQRNKRYQGHQITTSDKFVIYKVCMKEIVEFGPQGALRTEIL